MTTPDQVVTNILDDLRDPPHRALVVDSPPGAGKSTLVVRAARQLAEDDAQKMIVAQTNEQVDDLIDRLATADPALRIGRLSAANYTESERVQRPNVRIAQKHTDLTDRAIVIGTAAKWATVDDGTWSWAIVDEAYQMRSDMLLRIANRFDRALFVGDPGQLDPFATVDVDRWAGLSWDPTMSAVSVMLANNPDLPEPHRLPVSWRLPTSAASVVSAAFYPFTPFRAGTDPGQRRLDYATRGLRSPLDEALDMAAETGWAWYELPARHALRTDREAVSAIAALACRLLERGATAHSEQGSHPVTTERIAIGTAHRDQADAVRAALRGTPGEPITADTANRLQGREYDITIVLHPLSGRRDASAFHLEAGRLCVLTSRHRHACIVVGRAGIPELLDAHPSAEPVHLGVPVKFPDGWEANQSVLSHLAEHRISAAALT
ncbi:AAA domain-containing protein [Nocardia cyriacigeorgica]|uniref:AAA domain-containing protein n=1 Tax=Nocardia cyriacigeorgica TaxID=135487 RepID=UPI000CE9F935|nr:AAA domain-containing protein [Nocardia cyriacigeorgica]PPJ06401.1 helicase [Nocardia cyriacigeorgica]